MSRVQIWFLFVFAVAVYGTTFWYTTTNDNEPPYSVGIDYSIMGPASMRHINSSFNPVSKDYVDKMVASTSILKFDAGDYDGAVLIFNSTTNEFEWVKGGDLKTYCTTHGPANYEEWRMCEGIETH